MRLFALPTHLALALGIASFSTQEARAIVGQNDAPVLNTTQTPFLITGDLGGGAPVNGVTRGTPVSVLVDHATPTGQVDNVTDADLGENDALGSSVLGIAITGTSGNGVWYISLNFGATWSVMPAVSDASSLLLTADANTRLYFDGILGTTGALLTFRAWDRRTGSNGSVVNTTSNGGTTAFSTATDQAIILLNGVRAVRTGTASAGPFMNLTVASGTVAGDLVVLMVAAKGTGGINAPGFTPVVSQVQSTSPTSRLYVGWKVAQSGESLYSIMLSDAAVVTAVSFTGMNTVTALETATSAATSFSNTHTAPGAFTTAPRSLLTTWHEAAAAGNWIPPAGMLEVTDLTTGSGASGISMSGFMQALGAAGVIPPHTATCNGFASSGATASVVLRYANLPPTLDHTRSPMLASVNENGGAPSGAVGTLVSTLVDLEAAAGGVDNVFDADGDVPGIAVVGTDITNGSWYYSTNDGASWSTLTGVSGSNARLLSGSARIYFQPSTDFNGTHANALTFRAWDRTSGTDGGTANIIPGGNTTFSTSTDVVGITVVAGNDAPVLEPAASPTMPNTYQGAPAPTGAVGTLVSSWVDLPGGGGLNNVTDTDAGPVVGIAVVAREMVNGTWYYSLNNGSTWLSMASLSSDIVLLLDGNARLYFQPTPSYFGTLASAITFRAWDMTFGITGMLTLDPSTGGSSAFSTATDVVPLTVTYLNYAPVLEPAASPVLIAVAEDAPVPSGAVGTSVSALIDRASPSGQLDNVTDVNITDAVGIAITAAAPNGTWYYSTNASGTTWNTFPAITSSSSLLLTDQGRIYFRPSANYNGTLPNALTFRAWDATSGFHGSTASTSTNGGNTAFSSATDVASITVIPVNDAPVLDPAVDLVAGGSIEEGPAPSGAMGFLVSELVDFAVPAGQRDNITDVDASPELGVALVGMLLYTQYGRWYYSLNGGTTWTFIDFLSESQALVLSPDAGTRLYFRPVDNLSGIVQNALTFRAWDRTVGAPGDHINISTSGGTTAVSAVTDVVAVNVTPVNDAPILLTGPSPTLNAVLGNAVAPTGAVGTLVSSLMRMWSGSPTDNVMELDAGALTGMAITAAQGNGTWYYSINNGAAWSVLGTVSGTSARLLAADAATRLYFDPAMDENATAMVTFRAWDRTSGTNGVLADASINGGTTAFSIATDEASITVTHFNYAPVLNAAASPALWTINEDTPAPLGQGGTFVTDAIADLVGGSGPNNVSDADEFPNIGIAIIGVNAPGTLYYLLWPSSTWTPVPAVSPTSALLLGLNTFLYFQPDPDFNGTVPDLITFRAWDNTAGTSGSLVDASITGASTPFSTATDVASITVTPVNDAPVLNTTVPVTLGTVNRNAPVPTGAVGTLVSSLVDLAVPAGQLDNVTDIDAGAQVGIGISAINPTGTLYFTTNGGATWNQAPLGSTTFVLALAADADTRLYYRPPTNFSGVIADCITFRAWDRSSGTAGTQLGINLFDDRRPCSAATVQAPLTVVVVNEAPVIVSTPAATAIEDVTYSYQPSVIDADGPGQTWTLLPTHTCGGTLQPLTGQFTFTPTGPVPPASCILALQVCDNGSPNQCATQNAMINITPVNDPPVITSSAPTTATQDQAYTYQATSLDIDGPSVTWSLLGTNTCGGSIDPATGLFSFTPAGPTPPASCTVGIRVCDNGVPNECATQSITVNITDVAEDDDGDGVANENDICPGGDDALDNDLDGVPDFCDACPGHDDALDTDGDGVPEGCDICAGGDDGEDADGDGVPNFCDICAAGDDHIDTDTDGLPDACDSCPSIFGQIGSPCDDSNPLTDFDMLTSTCACAGTCLTPVIFSTVAPVQNRCATDSIGLYASATGAGPFTYATTGPGPVVPHPSLEAAFYIVGDVSGLYSIIVSNACGSDTAYMDLTILQVPTVSTTVTPSCGNDGAIDLTASGIAGPYQHIWINGECSSGCPTAFPICQFGLCTIEMEDLSGLAPGDYMYAVTIGNGCYANAVVTVPTNTTDSDGDGIVDCTDSCPNVAGQLGSSCNDNNTGTINDVIIAGCTCAGTPLVTCTENVTVVLHTDALSSQASWQILEQNTSNVLCQFSVPIDGIAAPIPQDCCLPVGCYRLRVTDSGGDGFVSGGVTGGYLLRETSGTQRRIIDNTGNFINLAGGPTDMSAMASTLDNGAFCVPIGNNKPVFQHCDKLDWPNDQLTALVASEDPLVSASWNTSTPPTDKGYEFWWFDPNGTYSYRRFRSHSASDGYSPANATRACKVKINGWSNTPTSPWLQVGKLYNVRIRARYGTANYSAFGPACLFKINPTAAACPLVKLQDNPANTTDYSCGVTRYFGSGISSGINMNSALPGSAANWGNKLVATPPQPIPAVASANVRYQFRFVNDGEYPAAGSCIIRPPQTSPTIYLNWTTGDKLKCGVDYAVDVRVSLDNGATWCVGGNTATPSTTQNPRTYWGPVCTVRIRMNNNALCPVQALSGEGSNMAFENTGGDLTMYPNPNGGDQLFIALSEVETGVNSVSVDIYDMRGKRVAARAIAVQDGYINTVLDLQGELGSGIYLVNITAGDKSYTERLVIQR